MGQLVLHNYLMGFAESSWSWRWITRQELKQGRPQVYGVPKASHKNKLLPLWECEAPAKQARQAHCEAEANLTVTSWGTAWFFFSHQKRRLPLTSAFRVLSCLHFFSLHCSPPPGDRRAPLDAAVLLKIQDAQQSVRLRQEDYETACATQWLSENLSQNKQSRVGEVVQRKALNSVQPQYYKKKNKRVS